MDDLRNRIWDYLYRRGEPQRVAIIADQMNETPDAIQQAADDPWFDVQDGLVAIAHNDRWVDSHLGSPARFPDNN